jgi:hypothetical protein
MKSEPVPSEQGDLKTLVAKNFKELVIDADKDALIEFVTYKLIRSRIDTNKFSTLLGVGIARVSLFITG